jgi:hypothetical protein
MSGTPKATDCCDNCIGAFFVEDENVKAIMLDSLEAETLRGYLGELLDKPDLPDSDRIAIETAYRGCLD